MPKLILFTSLYQRHKLLSLNRVQKKDLRLKYCVPRNPVHVQMAERCCSHHPTNLYAGSSSCFDAVKVL